MLRTQLWFALRESKGVRGTGVADGARTHDNRNHNPGLYQLSYSHHRASDYSERTSAPCMSIGRSPARRAEGNDSQRGSLAALSRDASADSLTLTLKRDFSAA